MSVFFRSYCSSSAGNCLALWTGDSCILIDCGLKTLRDCRALLNRHQNKHGPVSRVLVSHSHGDHLSGQALRVLEEEGIEIQSHPKVVPQLRTRHCAAGGSASPIQTFPGDEFTAGDFRIATVPLSHAPNVPTFGFVIRAGHGTRRRTIVICTDFYDPSDVLPHLADADFVFVEANHDVQLLREHFNPNSRFHLSNGETARLLVEAIRAGGRAPSNVMLGHLSVERNRDRLAMGEVEGAFARNGLRLGFQLETAPRYDASRVITIA